MGENYLLETGFLHVRPRDEADAQQATFAGGFSSYRDLCATVGIFQQWVWIGRRRSQQKAATRRRVALLLQLHRLDGDKISSWIVLSTTGKSEHGFYCSETLARGIEWLATLAPAQPELHAVDLRDLVAEKLYSTLNSSREETKANVAVSNKALQDTTAEVTNAANLSPLSVEAILDCVRAQYKSLLAPLEVYLSKLGYEEPEANRFAASILDGAVRKVAPGSWRRDEVGDFEKSLVFVSRLQGGVEEFLPVQSLLPECFHPAFWPLAASGSV
ncbi:hypothetical protein SELMODRAFT_405755 [Selaginella moellendorffii]|uniref:Uncharacterized protein n=1 Tax=Selaginella moellendorffii TaxID=88036 RepID=D8QZL7_SELML|nr:hypothetical protein SELMODRAFT_405755 [Selaginella moellendorffii]